MYVMGELIDAWLNQSISPAERIISAFTSYFFLQSWQEYLHERQADSPGLISVERNGMSHQSVKTFQQLAISLLSLFIAHREFYPAFPLMPWKHCTEPCEHIFGWFQKIFPDSCLLDARMMMPKIHKIIKNIMEKTISMPSADSTHAGYRFTYDYFHGDASHMKIYPTDDVIRQLLIIAQERAASLIKTTGMHKLGTDSLGISDHTPLESQLAAGVDSTFEFVDEQLNSSTFESELEPSELPEAMKIAAAQVANRQESDSLIEELDITEETIKEDFLSISRMSIQNLLNPECKFVAHIYSN